MGRGYSRSRSAVKRLTNKLKRRRSVSTTDAAREKAGQAVVDQILGSQATKSLSASNAAPNVPDHIRQKLGALLPPAERRARSASKAAAQRSESTSGRAAQKDEDDIPAVDAPAKRSISKAGQRAAILASRSRVGIVAKTLRDHAAAAKAAVAEMQAEDDDEWDDVSEPDTERISTPDVMTKYKAAGKIVDSVLTEICDACVVGANTNQLCEQGDAAILVKTKKVFQKAKDEEDKPIKRGISFPTTVCVNHILCHRVTFSDEEGVILAAGDVVKVHLSCHLDGYPVSACRTVVVQASGGADEDASPTDKPMTTAAANAIAATHYSLKALINYLRPGKKNCDATNLLHAVGRECNSQAIEGTLSNRTKRWILDGQKCIIGRRVVLQEPQQDVEDCEIGTNEVWTLDVAFTSDEEDYRMHEAPEDPLIFRRNEITQNVRLRATEEFVKEIRTNFLCFPFHCKIAEKPLKAKFAMKELKEVGMLDPMPVLCSRKRTITARACCTIAIKGNKVVVLAGQPTDLPASVINASDIELSQDILDAVSPAKSASKEDAGPRKARKTEKSRNAAEAVADD